VVDYKTLIQIFTVLKKNKKKKKKKKKKKNFIYYNKNSNFMSYSDSNFANHEKTRRSSSGYIFILDDGPISWKFQLQKNSNIINCQS